MSKSDTKAEKENKSLTNINRRQFVTGVTTAAGVGVGIGTQTRNANAFVVSGTALAIGGAAIAGGLAGAYLTKKVSDYFTGDNIDVSALKDKQAAEKHTQITKTALSMKATDESLLRNMSNLLQNAENAAYGDAKVAAIKELEANSSESVVNTFAVNAVDKFYATQQTNLVKHFNLQINKVENMLNLNAGESNLSEKVFAKVKGDGSYESHNDQNLPTSMPIDGKSSKTLVDGSSLDIEGITYYNGTYLPNPQDSTINVDTFTDKNIILGIKKPDDTLTPFIEFERFNSIWNKIANQHSTVKSDIQTWVTNVYPKYNQGDIDSSDLVTPSDIATMAGENTDNGFARTSAELAALGIEGAKHSYSIRLEGDGKTVNGTVYIQNQNISLQIEKTYSPSQFSNPVYMAIENPETGNTGTFVVEQDFTILEGVKPNGESVEEVQFRKNNQQTLSEDISEISKQLNDLTELQTKIDEQEKEIINDGKSSGGGGGVFSGSNPLTQEYAGIPLYLWLSGSGVILYLFGSE